MSDDLPPRPDVAPPAPPGPPRPPVTWRWWGATLVFLLGLLLGGALAALLFSVLPDAGTAFVAAALVAEAVTGGVLLVWLRLFHPAAAGAIGLARRPWAELRAGVVAGLILYLVVAFGVSLALSVLLQALSGEPVGAPQQLPSDLSGGGVAAAAVLALVAAPAVEELFFRGLLFRALRDRHPFAIAAATSGALFGAVHYIAGPWQDSVLLMSVMVFVGIGLAYVYERRGNILVPIAAHASFNAIGLVLILTQPLWADALPR